MPNPSSKPHPQERPLVARLARGRTSSKQDLAVVAGSNPDARFQIGAYLTDGRDLFEVIGVRHGRGQIGSAALRLILEDCSTLRRVEFLLDKIRRRFRLVREAPHTS